MRLTASFLLVIFLAGCSGTWQQKTRKAVDVTLKAGEKVFLLARRACDLAAMECIKNRTNPCPGIQKCHPVQRHIVRGYVALTSAALGVLHAIRVGDRDGALAKLQEAQQILLALRAGLAAYGVQL